MKLREYWSKVAALGCIVTGRPDATLHHCHGGSMVEVGVHRASGRKTSDWLVIPLHADLHVGRWGVDNGMGVKRWEMRFGRQVVLLDEVCRRLGINAWALAGVVRCPAKSQSMRNCSPCICWRAGSTAMPESGSSILYGRGVLTSPSRRTDF